MVGPAIVDYRWLCEQIAQVFFEDGAADLNSD